LQFGLYEKPGVKGNAAYLQAKHFDDSGRIKFSIDSFIKISEKNENHLLEEGDILFVGKGLRNFAWTYSNAIGPAVASSIFFVLKPDKGKVIPEFLTTLLNTPQTQAYMQTLGAGSSIPSIRKSELDAFSFHLPSIEVQKKVVTIAQLQEQDIDLSSRIIAEKQKIYQSVINRLILNSHE
jgi:restriction endonuclease S subunit